MPCAVCVRWGCEETESVLFLCVSLGYHYCARSIMKRSRRSCCERTLVRALPPSLPPPPPPYTELLPIFPIQNGGPTIVSLQPNHFSSRQKLGWFMVCTFGTHCMWNNIKFWLIVYPLSTFQTGKRGSTSQKSRTGQVTASPCKKAAENFKSFGHFPSSFSFSVGKALKQVYLKVHFCKLSVTETPFIPFVYFCWG